MEFQHSNIQINAININPYNWGLGRYVYVYTFTLF